MFYGIHGGSAIYLVSETAMNVIETGGRWWKQMVRFRSSVKSTSHMSGVKSCTFEHVDTVDAQRFLQRF